ncbi:MAG: NAD(P)/FAD-dependent oxidoreductase, partial [Polyangiaceae bacterium]
MRDHADVVIVGAGIMGLAVAYHLAEGGVTRVTVVDKGYLCSGASGRNGGGIRAQWSSEENVRLMLESIRVCRELSHKLKINLWLRQGGYLFLARTPPVRETLERSVSLQNRCGLSTRVLSPREARRVVPELDVTGVEAASFSPDDGVVFPWPFVWGYAQAARKLGVDVVTWHEVDGIDATGPRITGVHIRRCGPPGTREDSGGVTIRTSHVVNAAGAWSPKIAKMLGVHLPNRPHRHEICSTEPLKPWLKPLVADLSDGLYFSQSTRGEIVGGIASDYVAPGLSHASSHAFLGKYARSLVRTCPVMAEVKVIRQWAGCYDITPDGNPIVGPVDGVEGFYQVSGFTGHGFMMAPAVGKLLAGVVAGGPSVPLFDRWSLRR